MAQCHEDGASKDAVLEALFGKLDTIIQGQQKMAEDISLLTQTQLAVETGQRVMEKSQRDMHSGLAEVRARTSTLLSMAMIQELNTVICSKCKDRVFHFQGRRKGVESPEENAPFSDGETPYGEARAGGSQRLLKKRAQCSDSQRHTERSTCATASDPVNHVARRMPCFRDLPDISFSDKTFSEIDQQGDGPHDRGQEGAREEEHEQEDMGFDVHRLPSDIIQTVMRSPQPPSEPRTGRPQIGQDREASQEDDLRPFSLPLILQAQPAQPGRPGCSSDTLLAPAAHPEEPSGAPADEDLAAAEVVRQRPRSNGARRRVHRKKFVSNPLPDSERVDKSDMLYLNKDMLDLLEERAQQEDSS